MKKLKKGLRVLKWRALIVALLIAVSTAILVNASITCHNLYWSCTFVACAIGTIVLPLYIIREVKYDDDATDAIIEVGTWCACATFAIVGIMAFAMLCFAIVIVLKKISKQAKSCINKVYCIGGMVTLSGLGLAIISGILNSYFNFVVISIIENISLYLILGGVALLIVTLISHAVFSINLHK